MTIQEIIEAWNGCCADGGSGGGGEIPTATVTFINSASGYVYYVYPVNLVDGVITQSEVRVETSVDLQMPLGENGTFIPLGENIDSDTAPVLTGDIEAVLDIDESLIGFKVTGDGTITLKGTGAE